MKLGSIIEKCISPIGADVWVAARSAKFAIALISLLASSHAEAADLTLRTNRIMRPPAFSAGGHLSTCVGCLRACRRNGGPIEKVCEALCLETCGDK